MTIILNHTIVPARDKVMAARFFAGIWPTYRFASAAASKFGAVFLSVGHSVLRYEPPIRAPLRCAIPRLRGCVA
jgi:hypothetical protein